jgi:putative MATE family efflux protein
MNKLSLSKNPEAKEFYSSLVKIVAPIAGQNLITAAVSSADVIMLGSVSQTAIAAASLAGQIQFILFMFFTGLSSGMIMLSAQYWGKKDLNSIRTLLGIALRISFVVGFVFAIASIFAPEFLMRLYTNEQPLIEQGAIYLRTVGFAYLVMPVSQIFQATLKSVEKVKTVTIITIVALSTNILLNAIFIYGWFGIPKMGIFGVALATLIARILEAVLCVTYASTRKDVSFNLGCFFRFNKILTKDFYKYSLPALGNELVWGTAFSVYSVILGHLGEDIVAANSVVNVVKNLATVLCFGMSYGGAIILGKQMGAGNLEVAERNASRLVKTTILSGVLGSIFFILCRPLLPFIAELSPTATYYTKYLLYINAASIIGAAVNTVLICGVFRAGGDAKFGFIADTISMWCVSVPLGLLAAFVFKLPPLWVYFVLFLDEFEKMPVIIHHYFKKTWLRDITNSQINSQ